MEPLHNALEILSQIVTVEYISALDDECYFFSTSHFTVQYGISDRTFKRYIDDLRQLGADVYSERSPSGRYVWRCRNWRELNSNGRFKNWLRVEREKAAGLALNAPDPVVEHRVCTMNCGPATWDTRTRAERMSSCSDCEIVRAPNREESRFHLDDEGFNKRQRVSIPPV